MEGFRFNLGVRLRVNPTLVGWDARVVVDVVPRGCFAGSIGARVTTGRPTGAGGSLITDVRLHTNAGKFSRQTGGLTTVATGRRGDCLPIRLLKRKCRGGGERGQNPQRTGARNSKDFSHDILRFARVKGGSRARVIAPFASHVPHVHRGKPSERMRQRRRSKYRCFKRRPDAVARLSFSPSYAFVRTLRFGGGGVHVFSEGRFVSVANASPFAAAGVPLLAPDGRELVILVVKATFALLPNEKFVVADEQVPVRLGDEPYRDDGIDSSILFPSDVGLTKRGVDIVVVGEAVSPKPVRALDVATKIGERTVPLRVHGERVYYRSGSKVTIGPAAPFERKAIVYENAYGGTTPDFQIVERRNPVGLGVRHREADLVDTKAPSIEHPAEPITSAADKPSPVGFGAIATHWQPRSDFAGTFDETWRKTRLPLMPLDFDVRYWNIAHPSMQVDSLPVETPIAVLGMRDGPVFRFDVPEIRITAFARTEDGKTLSQRPTVDTVVVVPGQSRVEIVTRAVFPLGRGKTSLREVRVTTND